MVVDQNYYLGDEEIPQQQEESKEEYNMRTIKKGDKGKAVKIWQIIVGCTPDGIFGPITAGKTIEWQKAHGLDADGIVGKNTWKIGLDMVQ